MSTTPTTEGSIVAKLQLDRSEYRAGIEAAKAEARSLNDTNPTITVDTAGTAEAQSALAGVAAAETNLQLAIDRTRLAYLRLDEIQSKEGDNSIRALAAHLGAARAESAEEAAVLKLAAAKEALAAATDEDTAATDRNIDAQTTTISRLGLIVTAIALLIPLLASLVGYVAAVSGGLAAMGLVGVVAVLGIKDAMASGTPVGKQYSDGIATLKANFDILANTGAVGLLAAFNSAVVLVTSQMPSLNNFVSTFSTILGTTASSVLTAFISGLNTILPLLVTGGVYVQQLAAGFLSWTQNGGLSNFVSFVLGTFPQVAQTLGQLVQAATKIVEATAPIGTVVLGALRLLAGAINGLPTPVLLDLIAAVGGGVLAFKAFGLIVPLIEGVTTALFGLEAAENLALGPIGLVVAGVAALTSVFLTNQAANDKVSQATQTYTSILETNTGAINDNLKAAVTKQLLDDGALKAAQQLGISASVVVNATLGQAKAQTELNAAVAQAAEQYKQTSDGSGTYISRTVGLSASQRAAKADVDLLTGSVSNQSQGLKDAVSNQNLYNQGLNTTAYQASQAAAQLAIMNKAIADAPAANRTIIGPTVGGVGSQFYVQKHATGGTVYGPGTSTSDSVFMAASVGEEVTSSSRADMYRPLLKAVQNGSPADIAAASQAAVGSTPTANTGGNTYPTTIITQPDPSAAFADFQRRQNLRVA